MPKINYGDVAIQCYSERRERIKLLIPCFYKNNSLAVVGELSNFPDVDIPAKFTKRCRIIILGNGKYAGLALDYIYPKSQKLARQLADELDDPNWLNYDNLSQDDRNKLYQKLKKVAGI